MNPIENALYLIIYIQNISHYINLFKNESFRYVKKLLKNKK